MSNPVKTLNRYIQKINRPMGYVGISARTREPICRIIWSPTRQRFVWNSYIPEESWSGDMAESLFHKLNELDANKEELTKPLRIREVKEENA